MTNQWLTNLSTLINHFFLTIQIWIIKLHPNQVSLLESASTIVAAIVGIKIAFAQLAKQFEHKVMYEGWSDLQSKLFEFSKNLSLLSSKTGWLIYMINTQHNPIMNQGNVAKYRFSKWEEWSDAFQRFRQSYVEFLISYETNELIFMPLAKMKSLFYGEVDERIIKKYDLLLEKIFPEIIGATDTFTDAQKIDLIRESTSDMAEITAYLIDFRVELQNVTIGRVLGKQLGKRKPNVGYKILTQRGFIVQSDFKYSISVAIKQISELTNKISETFIIVLSTFKRVILKTKIILGRFRH